MGFAKGFREDDVACVKKCENVSVQLESHPSTLQWKGRRVESANVQYELLIPLRIGCLVSKASAHRLVQGDTIAINELHLAIDLAGASKALTRND